MSMMNQHISFTPKHLSMVSAVFIPFPDSLTLTITDLISVTRVLPFLEHHINATPLYVVFCVASFTQQMLLKSIFARPTCS